nr:PREDICTED: uncharacterized protein LOC105663215 [Megachile rotundata]
MHGAARNRRVFHRLRIRSGATVCRSFPYVGSNEAHFCLRSFHEPAKLNLLLDEQEASLRAIRKTEAGSKRVTLHGSVVAIVVPVVTHLYDRLSYRVSLLLRVTNVRAITRLQ